MTAAPTPAPTAPTGAKCVHPLASAAPAIPPPAAGKDCPVDPEMGGAKLVNVDVTFPEANGLKVTAEVAKGSHEVERGLMYRRTMPDDHGMLFKLSERRVQTFWMQNTCIPLDIIFVEDDGTIVGVGECAKPLDESIVSVPCPSQWVLEMNAGWVRKHGVKPGQKMTIPASAR